MQQVCPHHGDPLLDGNAHSVRYGEMLHDRSGQPDSANSKKGQIPKLSSWEVTQQNLRIKKKIKCEKDRKECRTLQTQDKNIQQFGNVDGCDDECDDIHGKEFPG